MKKRKRMVYGEGKFTKEDWQNIAYLDDALLFWIERSDRERVRNHEMNLQRILLAIKHGMLTEQDLCDFIGGCP